MIQPFHLAIPVQSLEPCRTFYRDILHCEEGRSDIHWVDSNFFGHQLVIHQKEDFEPRIVVNPMDNISAKLNRIYIERAFDSRCDRDKKGDT